MNGDPFWDDLIRLLLLRDYPTRMVLAGTAVLGMIGGVVGTLLLMRKRSLLGDVVSHAALPGIALAFLVAEILSPGSGRASLPLQIGAWIAGMAGGLSTLAILKATRIKEDAALALVLSIFFGFGIVCFTIVQKMPTGSAAGLERYIFGQPALIQAGQVRDIVVVAVVLAGLCVLFFKELTLVCFDEDFAAAQGWPVGGLDLLLMAMVVTFTVIGMQAAGLLLVVAMLVIPSAAARFWTDRLGRMTLIAALLGGLGAVFGTAATALIPKVATGAAIVLAGTTLFVVSMLAGVRRGVLAAAWRRRDVRRRVGRDDLLRAVYEAVEARRGAPADRREGLADTPIALHELTTHRNWSPRRWRELLRWARRSGWLTADREQRYRLTPAGAEQALRAVRAHRLWELYLAKHANVAPHHLDRGADEIEHHLDGDTLTELREVLSEETPAAGDSSLAHPSLHPLKKEPDVQ